MEAFRERDLGDFIYALEFLNADINRADESGTTIFQTILKTPRSDAFIRSCISNGADCYTVRSNNSAECIPKLITFRKLPTIVFRCTSRSTRFVHKI